MDLGFGVFVGRMNGVVWVGEKLRKYIVKKRSCLIGDGRDSWNRFRIHVWFNK